MEEDINGKIKITKLKQSLNYINRRIYVNNVRERGVMGVQK
jgi:hypothetical protein